MSGLRIDVADLLAHPGARRAWTGGAELDGLASSVARVAGPLAVDVVLEHIPEGIVVRGAVRATWTAECGRCLRPLTRELVTAVDELFERSPVEGETYALEGHEIDLEQLARDAVVLELPLAPHCEEPCRADAAGDAGDHDPDRDREPDPRWAALSELEL
jgi:DUF177 domain-containing protein